MPKIYHASKSDLPWLRAEREAACAALEEMWERRALKPTPCRFARLRRRAGELALSREKRMGWYK